MGSPKSAGKGKTGVHEELHTLFISRKRHLACRAKHLGHVYECPDDNCCATFLYPNGLQRHRASAVHSLDFPKERKAKEAMVWQHLIGAGYGRQIHREFQVSFRRLNSELPAGTQTKNFARVDFALKVCLSLNSKVVTGLTAGGKTPHMNA